MDQDERDRKKFLEEQVVWCEEKKFILDEIDHVLHKMKDIAQYVLQFEITQEEIKELNHQMEILKSEIHFLEQQLDNEIVH